jgi:hypothetical protein
MQKQLLANLVAALLTLFDSDLLKKFADTIIDFAENFVLGTKSKVDDKLVLPLCDLVRKTFGIEDNDEPSEPVEDT